MIELFISKIRRLAEDFADIRFLHVCWRGNKAAHELATLAVDSKCTRVLLEEVHHSCRDIVAVLLDEDRHAVRLGVVDE